MKFMNAGLVLVLALLAACGSDSAGDRQPVNQAPTVSAIADNVAVANTSSQPIVFSVDDEDVSNLAVTVSSDRLQLVPDTGLAIAGSGTVRTLTITPAVDRVGDAMITVIVRDAEGLAASASFLFTVNAESKSMQQFARELFISSEDGEPTFINAVEFAQDADEDDFADLLAE